MKKLFTNEEILEIKKLFSKHTLIMTLITYLLSGIMFIIGSLMPPSGGGFISLSGYIVGIILTIYTFPFVVIFVFFLGFCILVRNEIPNKGYIIAGYLLLTVGIAAIIYVIAVYSNF